MAENTSSTINRDTWIRSGDATVNFGTGTSLFIYGGGENYNRALIDFTLPSLSGDISKIELFIYEYNSISAGTADILSMTRTNWTLLGVTWNKYDGTNNWTTAGGDYGATIIDSTTIGDGVGWKTFVLQGTGATNALSLNWGDTADLIIKINNESTDKGSEIASSRYTDDTTKRPYIKITYTAASGPANLKSLNTNLKSNIKSYNTNLIANVKSINTNI